MGCRVGRRGFTSVVSLSTQDDDRPRQLLVLDASIMINFLLVNSWPMLLRITSYRMVTPSLVTEQIRKDRRRAAIKEALTSGALLIVDEPIPDRLLPLFPDWVRRFGEQDAAVLLNALALNASMGADDRGLCNEAERQGVVDILGTESLLAEAVRDGQISLQQGNGRLRRLRQERFQPRVPCLCALCDVPCTCR